MKAHMQQKGPEKMFPGKWQSDRTKREWHSKHAMGHAWDPFPRTCLFQCHSNVGHHSVCGLILRADTQPWDPEQGHVAQLQDARLCENGVVKITCRVRAVCVDLDLIRLGVVCRASVRAVPYSSTTASQSWCAVLDAPKTYFGMTWGLRVRQRRQDPPFFRGAVS